MAAMSDDRGRRALGAPRAGPPRRATDRARGPATRTSAVFRPGGPSRFGRLARTQALMTAGDVCMTVALADSLFLDISPTAARGKVLLFLALSFLPFVVVAPLIGPFIDRMAGGRRMMVALIAASRVVVTLVMAFNIDTLALFPLAFASLVLAKTYSVCKSALVPSTVRDEQELVEANSKLGLVSGVVSAVAVAPAGLLQLLFGSTATLIAGSLVFVAAVVGATQLPADVVAARGSDARERRELGATGVVLAASAMALLRASQGFLFFHLAFWLRTQDAGLALFGVAVAFSTLGTFTGNLIGPAVRRSIREELMLTSALALTAAAGIGAAIAGGVVSAILLNVVVSLSAAVGRLGFDAIVQRDAPGANHGRAFAQFETRFQFCWAVAGVVPVLLRLPGRVGFLAVGAIAAFAVASYVVWTHRVREGREVPDPLTKRARRQVRNEVQRRRERREGTSDTGAARDLPPPPPPPPRGP